MKDPRNIVLTGASSGLGKALALHYAKPGITLHLQGRHSERLEAVVKDCQSRGAEVRFRCLDVTDRAAMMAWLAAAEATGAIDLVIANAGISAGLGDGMESDEQTRAIFATNIDGVVHTIEPLIPAMIQRGRGQIAIMSSLAGIRGLPSSPAYSASKACVRVWGEGLRGWLSTYGVEVCVICPGFIKTPMTDINPYRMPFIMEADKAAAIIANGLAANKSRIAFPPGLYLPLLLFSSLPQWLADRLFALLPAKPSFPQTNS